MSENDDSLGSNLDNPYPIGAVGKLSLSFWILNDTHSHTQTHGFLHFSFLLFLIQLDV